MSTSHATVACPCCGGTDFQKGILKQAGRTDPVEFAADQVDSSLPRWLEGLFASAGVGGVPTESRVCAACGYISLFVTRK